MKTKSIITLAAIAAGGLLLLKKKPISGVGATRDWILTPQEESDAFHMYAYCLWNDRLYNQTMEIYKKYTDNRGFVAADQLSKWMSHNMPIPYNKCTQESYDMAAYLLVGSLHSIATGFRTWEQVVADAQAEVRVTDARNKQQKLVVPESFLRFIEQMTDDNAHTEARQEVARFFDNYDFEDSGLFSRFVSYFDKLKLIHNKQGYLSKEQLSERRRMTHDMFDTARRIYPENEVDKIWSKL